MSITIRIAIITAIRISVGIGTNSAELAIIGNEMSKVVRSGMLLRMVIGRISRIERCFNDGMTPSADIDTGSAR